MSNAVSAAESQAASEPAGARGDRRRRSAEELGPKYKWIALSNTTLGMLVATINSSIVLIALPDIFKGIKINPLESSNTSYLLWMMMGFLVVTAVLVVSFGRLGDMYGRARMYNMGFAVFTVASVFLAITWFDGSNAALWLIGWRVVQGIGGAFLMANSSAILTDVFPQKQRGLALGINGVAAIAGSFLGLVIGGLLAPVNWNLIFLVSVPFGIFGTIWAYAKLHDTGIRQHARMDWWGNITFAIGLIAILVGITYGIQPYRGASMGWGNPWVIGALAGGAVILAIFMIIETRVDNPLFNLSLFTIRSFTFGNIANLMASLGRGGLQFILIIWLQGIWLPQHGYSFERTPLWAGIYMLPLTVGFLITAPVSGLISDRVGTRWFAALGMVLTAGSFLALIELPVDFDYRAFAAILVLNGVGMGLFAAPNRAEVMNSLPGDSRGAGAGMMTTFQNAAMVLSIGIFFSLIIAGLSRNLPDAMNSGLTSHGVPAGQANQLAHLPAVAVLFAAFLGYNPIQQLLGSHLSALPAGQAQFLTGRSFFPHLISGPFSDGLTIAFVFAIVACAIGAVASYLCGPDKKDADAPEESVGSELASVAAEAGMITAELVRPPAVQEHLNGAGQAPAAVVSSGPVAFSGLVVDGAGHPVQGSVLTVTDQRGTQAGRVEVGPDGRYVLHDLAPGHYTLIAGAPGYAPQVRAGSAGEEQPYDFRLTGSGTIAGQVRSARPGGGGIGATVVLTDGRGEVIGNAASDSGGLFRLSGLPTGTFAITAHAAGHRPDVTTVAVHLEHAAAVTFDLVPLGGVRGLITSPAGSGLPDVTVTVVSAAGDVVASAVTDRSGEYELAGLADGEYTLVTGTYRPAEVAVVLDAGENVTTDVELGITPAH